MILKKFLKFPKSEPRDSYKTVCNEWCKLTEHNFIINYIYPINGSYTVKMFYDFITLQRYAATCPLLTICKLVLL